MTGGVEFPPELPISARVADIAEAIDAHQVVVVAGATGSGKTTQLPKIALAMGRGLEKLIGVTQPRRLAATSVAARVASELGTELGRDVGYQIRFDDRTSAATYVKFMTDGILLAEIQRDPLLSRYDTIVIDEAHERSLTIDFLLGWVKRILPERPDLRVVVSSATLETERFSAFFDGAPVIEVEGRTYPVDVLYEPPGAELDFEDGVVRAVVDVCALDPHGDVLVFLPGEREIREIARLLEAKDLRFTTVLPLYGRLASAEQHRVFSPTSSRRVILATNVAETSVTIPGVVYVVDAGVARLSRYDPRSGTTRLHVEAISKASAEQRKGRAGRVRDGVCVRLYDEASFAARPDHTDPEIRRTGLAGVILRMKALGLGDVERFPFLDPPSSRSITDGYRVLEELGALDASRELTPLGRKLARFPIDPRIGRMIVAAHDRGCLPEVLVVASALSIQDPRERPREQQQKADDAHRRFADERSDFVTWLRLWELVREAEAKGTSNLRRFCKANFLSFVRVREWREVRRQLDDIVREGGLDDEQGMSRRGGRKARHGRPSDDGLGGAREDRAAPAVDDDALHASLLTGLLSRVGYYQPEQKSYVGARQTRFVVHRSSPLSRKPPAWVMAFELVETTQLFARTVAKIQPEWLIDAGAHVVKRSYADPHWSERSARARVREHVTLFGLTVARDRTVDYAPIAPAEARRIFIEHALVRGEMKTKAAFCEKNRALLAEVAKLRDKARRSDVLADDDALAAFFDARLPAEVVDGPTFEQHRTEVEARDPDAFVLTMEAVLAGDRPLSPRDYPDAIVIRGVTIPVSYTFDPSADDDGVTLTVPLALLAQLERGELDWTIPGWHEEKVLRVLELLPRGQRQQIGPLKERAKEIAATLRPGGSFSAALSRAVEDVTGVVVDERALSADGVPGYLRSTVRVIDDRGKVVASSRDADDLLTRLGGLSRDAARAAPRTTAWEQEGLTAWTFGDLPSSGPRLASGVSLYPALVDRITSVDRTLLASEKEAAVATRAGVRRLLLFGARRDVSALVPRLPPALARPSGATPSRADNDAFRAMLLTRIADEAFRLDDDVPRTKAAFEARLVEGAPRLAAAARLWSEAVTACATEIDKTLAALRQALRQPSGRDAVSDIRAQLERLLPDDLIAHVPLARLAHVPRYLRAAQARLVRAIHDPRKDAAKLAPITPLFAAFERRAGGARDVETAAALRWMFEELRVSVFAPELKTPVPVSLAKLTAAVDALS